MLAIAEHGIRNLLPFDCVPFAPGNEPPNFAPQHFLVEKDPPTYLDAIVQNTQTGPTQYAVNRIGSHDSS